MAVAVTMNPANGLSTEGRYGGVVFNAAALRGHMGIPAPTQQLDGTRLSSINTMDVFLLLIELMKLDIESQEHEKGARNEERRLQLKNLEKEVANYKTQAKWQLFGGLGAGIMGTIAGIAPVLGHTHGNSILSALGKITSRFDGIKKRDFFEMVAKVLGQAKDTQQATGQMLTTKAEAERKRFETYSANHRTDHEHKSERSRALGQKFKETDQLLGELIRMRHEVAMRTHGG